jgi:hypothetical protein
MDLKEKIEKELELLPFFEEQFAYGMMTGIALFLSFLMGMLGIQFSIHEGQVHAITLLWIDAMWMASYYLLRKFPMTKAKRFFVSMSIVTFIFEIHDNIWVTSTLFNLEALMRTELKGIFISTPEFYIAKYSRNLIITVASFLFAKKYFSYGWKQLGLFLIVAAYWVIVVYLELPYVLWHIMFCVDSLPLVALMCFPKEGEKT